jgi:hypothetical protein
MSRRGVLATVACWLPVTAVVVALFVVPSSTEAAGPRPLTVRPGADTYGGQLITFSGDMGSGIQRIRLQRRDNLAGAWGTVISPRTGKPFSTVTKANGTFSFGFPAPAMNGTYFRVASAKAVTEAHQFDTVHQDVEASTVEVDPADVPLPRGIVVAGEGFRVAADTVEHDRSGKPTKPILQGRVVTLQVRSGDGWKPEATTTIGRDGRLDFGDQFLRAVTGKTPVVYRVVMANWTKNGDRVGWMPSLPLYLDVVNRPPLVRSLDAAETPSSVTLTWSAPTDPVDRIIVARADFGRPHPVWDEIASVPGGATQYVDSFVFEGPYEYALYSVTDGIYSREGAPIHVDVPAEPDPKRGVN